MPHRPALTSYTSRVTSRRRRSVALTVPIILALLLMTMSRTEAQSGNFFVPSDTFNKTRFWVSTGAVAGIYTATVIGLNEIWYKQYPRGSFHFQDDWGEWENVDKMGHMFTAYMYSKWISDLTHWTGVPRKSADWAGFGASMLFQTTIEIMDGFSDRWGFSWSDMAFNTAGRRPLSGTTKALGRTADHA